MTPEEARREGEQSKPFSGLKPDQEGYFTPEQAALRKAYSEAVWRRLGADKAFDLKPDAKGRPPEKKSAWSR